MISYPPVGEWSIFFSLLLFVLGLGLRIVIGFDKVFGFLIVVYTHMGCLVVLFWFRRCWPVASDVDYQDFCSCNYSY